jgi:hypothetical protein
MWPLMSPELAKRGAVVTEGTHVIQDAAGDTGDDCIERLIGPMQHGIHIYPFPADGCVYNDRDTRGIRLLRELLTLRREAAGLA